MLEWEYNQKIPAVGNYRRYQHASITNNYKGKKRGEEETCKLGVSKTNFKEKTGKTKLMSLVQHPWARKPSKNMKK